MPWDFEILTNLFSYSSRKIFLNSNASKVKEVNLNNKIKSFAMCKEKLNINFFPNLKTKQQKDPPLIIIPHKNYNPDYPMQTRTGILSPFLKTTVS